MDEVCMWRGGGISACQNWPGRAGMEEREWRNRRRCGNGEGVWGKEKKDGTHRIHSRKMRLTGQSVPWRCFHFHSIQICDRCPPREPALIYHTVKVKTYKPHAPDPRWLWKQGVAWEDDSSACTLPIGDVSLDRGNVAEHVDDRKHGGGKRRTNTSAPHIPRARVNSLWWGGQFASGGGFGRNQRSFP